MCEREAAGVAEGGLGVAEAPDLVPWGSIWTGSQGPAWDPVTLLLLKLTHLLLASGGALGALGIFVFAGL